MTCCKSSEQKALERNMRDTNQRTNTMKVCFIGDPEVGKSTLAMRLDGQPFRPNRMATIGVDFVNYPFALRQENGEIVKTTMQIWDTAGQEAFRSLVQSFYRRADGVVFVYDVRKPESLESIKNYWVREVKRSNPGITHFLLLGNFMDQVEAENYEFLDRPHVLEEIMETGQWKYHKTSATYSETEIKDIFDAYFETLVRNKNGPN